MPNYYKLSNLDNYIPISENIDPVCNSVAPNLSCPSFEAAKYISIINDSNNESQRLLLKNFSRTESGEYITCRNRDSTSLGFKLTIPYTQAMPFFCIPSKQMIADKTSLLRYNDIILLFAIDTVRGGCNASEKLSSGPITLINNGIFQDNDEIGLKENSYSWKDFFGNTIKFWSKTWDIIVEKLTDVSIPFRLKAPPGYENSKYIKYGDPIIFEAIKNDNRIMFNECQNDRVVLSDKNPKIDANNNLISGGRTFSQETYLFRFFTDDYDGIPCEITDYKGYCLEKDGSNFLYDENCLAYCEKNSGNCESIKLDYCKGDNLTKPMCSTFCAKNPTCQLALKDYCKDKNPGSSPEIRKVCGCFYSDKIYAQYQQSLAKKLGLDMPMDDSIGCFPDCDNSDVKPSQRQCQRNIVNCVSSLVLNNEGGIESDSTNISQIQDCNIFNKNKKDDSNKDDKPQPVNNNNKYIFVGIGVFIFLIILLVLILIVKERKK